MDPAVPAIVLGSMTGVWWLRDWANNQFTKIDNCVGEMLVKCRLTLLLVQKENG